MGDPNNIYYFENALKKFRVAETILILNYIHLSLLILYEFKTIHQSKCWIRYPQQNGILFTKHMSPFAIFYSSLSFELILTLTDDEEISSKK